jgi:hypothetical protein
MPCIHYSIIKEILKKLLINNFCSFIKRQKIINNDEKLAWRFIEEDDSQLAPSSMKYTNCNQ